MRGAFEFHAIPSIASRIDFFKIRRHKLMPAYFGFSLIPATTEVGAPGHQLILSILARCRHAGCTGDPCSLPPRSWVGIYVPYACVFWSLRVRIYTKARKYRSWCGCETTAPRLFMSTPRTSTPPILVLQLCGHRIFCSGIGRYLWLPVVSVSNTGF